MAPHVIPRRRHASAQPRVHVVPAPASPASPPCRRPTPHRPAARPDNVAPPRPGRAGTHPDGATPPRWPGMRPDSRPPGPTRPAPPAADVGRRSEPSPAGGPARGSPPDPGRPNPPSRTGHGGSIRWSVSASRRERCPLGRRKPGANPPASGATARRRPARQVRRRLRGFHRWRAGLPADEPSPSDMFGAWWQGRRPPARTVVVDVGRACRCALQGMPAGRARRQERRRAAGDPAARQDRPIRPPGGPTAWLTGPGGRYPPCSWGIRRREAAAVGGRRSRSVPGAPETSLPAAGIAVSKGAKTGSPDAGRRRTRTEGAGDRGRGGDRAGEPAHPPALGRTHWPAAGPSPRPSGKPNAARRGSTASGGGTGAGAPGGTTYAWPSPTGDPAARTRNPGEPEPSVACSAAASNPRPSVGSSSSASSGTHAQAWRPGGRQRLAGLGRTHAGRHRPQPRRLFRGGHDETAPVGRRRRAVVEGAGLVPRATDHRHRPGRLRPRTGAASARRSAGPPAPAGGRSRGSRPSAGSAATRGPAARRIPPGVPPFQVHAGVWPARGLTTPRCCL